MGGMERRASMQVVPVPPSVINNWMNTKFHKLTIAAAMSVLSVTAAQAAIINGSLASDGDTHLYGSMSYSEDWVRNGRNRFGIYELPTSGNPTYFPNIVEAFELKPTGGCVYYDGKFFNSVPFISPAGDSVEWTDYLTFDTSDWSIINETRLLDNEFFANDLAYDPTTDRVYGSIYVDDENGNYVYFGILDMNTYQVTPIKRITSEATLYKALAFDAVGQCYGITADGSFVKVDKKTGDTELVSSTGLETHGYVISGAIDPKNEIFYYAFSNDTQDALYAIDLSTGNATKLYDMPWKENFDGMFVIGPQAQPKTPAAVAGLTCSLTGNHLDCEVAFTAPATLYDGTPASGSMTFDVLVNGERKATLQGEAGAELNIGITLEKAEKYVIAIVPYNEAGRGGVATTAVWVGDDIPAPVSNISLTYSDGAFNLSWCPPKGANGGYIDPAEVTYDLTRYPDMATIKGVTDTTITIPMAEPVEITNYTYEIVANYAGHSSEIAVSPICVLGALVPPYTQDFEAEGCMQQITLIDGNGDNDTWRLYSNCAIIWKSDSGKDLDDWLILPPMKLEQGVSYRLSFDASVLYGSTEAFEVKLGTAPVADAMTLDLIDVTEITNTAYQQHEATVEVPSTGVYYIGFHALSPNATGYAMFLDNISLNAAGAGLLEVVGNATPSVATVGNTVMVANDKAVDINIYTASGALVKSASGVTTATFVLAPGVYFVNAGNSVRKVIVR